MSESTQTLEQFANRDYEWGFVTDIEADSAPPGLNEEIIRFISAKKDEPEFMLDWRLKAYRRWLTMEDPTRRKESQRWAMVHYPDINYQDIVYYSAPSRNSSTASTRSIPKFWPPTRSSASPSKSRRCSPAWLWTPFSTASPWPPRSRTS